MICLYSFININLLFAEDRILDQRLHYRCNLEPESNYLSKVVRTNHRILQAELDIDRHIEYFGRPSNKYTHGNGPFVSRAGLIVIGDGRVRPCLPGIWQVKGQRI